MSDGLRTVRVPLGERSYDVLVGHGARTELASLLPATARRAAVVTQPGIPLEIDPGIPYDVFQIGTGEDGAQFEPIRRMDDLVEHRGIASTACHDGKSRLDFPP